jgi:hypothetical protein
MKAAWHIRGSGMYVLFSVVAIKTECQGMIEFWKGELFIFSAFHHFSALPHVL